MSIENSGDNIKKKKSFHKRLIAASVIIPVLVIAVLVFILLTQEQKVMPDPASEAVIRQAAAKWFISEKKINKDPNKLTNEDFAEIEFIEISGNELCDFSFFKNFKNLHQLTLNKIRYTESHIPYWMKILSKLGVFDLNERFTIDLSPLADLNLGALEFFDVPIKDISPLTNITNLYELSLCGTQVSDLRPIKGLTKLHYILLGETPVSDLEPIKELKNLDLLEIDNTMISDIEPLKGLTKLTVLLLNDTPVSNLKPLKGLTNLESLDLSNCKNITEEQVEDLQKALPNLKISR